MMSYYEARKLDQLERDLRQGSPELARKFEQFGFRLVLLRLVATTVGTAVVFAFIFVEKSIDAIMLGTGLVALFSWELRRRTMQLRHLPRSRRKTVSQREV